MEIKIKSLSVIIPCYNEEDVIESTINKIESIANRLQDDLKIISSYEIVVVNNGSTDETLKRSVQFVKKVKKFKLCTKNELIGIMVGMLTMFTFFIIVYLLIIFVG